MRVSFARAGAPPIDAELGAVVFEGPQSLLQEARPLGSGPGIPEEIVAKRGKQRGDYGRLELEQLACERLEHPGLARYFGAARTEAFGTVLAFEKLGANPLTLLNGPELRPRWRDPGTHFYPLPPGRALELAYDALLAIEYVHSRGFVHGGVTLANLRVRTPGSLDAQTVLERVAEGNFEGTLAGLGGARALSFIESLRGGQVHPELTPMPERLHAPPEALIQRQDLGGKLVFSPAMDTYSWALVLYQLTTGRAPYDRYAKPSEVAIPQVLLELKAREAKGQVSPIWIDALDAIPLHDVAFVTDAAKSWPDFRTSVAHLLRRCTDPDPRERMESSAARAFFEEELRMRPSLTSGQRPWTQRTFQMRPTSNRLLGDHPGAGISVKEEEGGRLAVIEKRAPARPKIVVPKAVPVGDGTLVTFRPQDHAARTAVRAREGALASPVREMVPVKDVLLAFRTKKPLPVSGPYLITTLGLSPKELARSAVYSLGRAAARVKITGTDMDEEIRVTVGRGDDNDVVLPDASISKRHAAFEKRNGKWYVEDVGSSNGTTVDGKRLSPKMRVALRGKMVKITFGPSFEVGYLEDSEFRAYLQQALEVVEGALRAKNAPAAATSSTDAAASQVKFLDEAPQDSRVSSVVGAPPPPPPTTPEVPVPARADAVTTKFRRDVVSRGGPIEFPIVRRDAPAPPPPKTGLLAALNAKFVLSRIEGLVRQSVADRAKYRIVFEGDRVDLLETPEDVVIAAREAPLEVVKVEVVPFDRSDPRLVYARDSAP